MNRHNQSTNYLKRLTGVGALVLMAGGIGFLSIADAGMNYENTSQETGSDNLPDTLTLDCTIRDFKPKQWAGGHPDFEFFGGTTTVGLVQDYLDENGKPVVADLRGQKIKYEYKDSQGRNINPSMYDPQQGDVKGKLVAGGTGNGFTSEARFNQWYRDVPGVNLSKGIQLKLTRVAGTDRYVFDSAVDTEHGTYGFFPVNGDLYGNYRQNRNYHFTTEINTVFTYHHGTGQVFKFTGDDDVWVFIDGRLAVDLGGLHPKREQFLDLDRLDWLQDGKTHTLDIFHAERRYSGSNFRIETTLQLRGVDLPPVSAVYD